MSIGDDRNFRQQLEKSDNPYRVVRDIGKQARALSEEYNNSIFHSEAITHILQGSKPSNKYYFSDEYEAVFIKEMFCYIDDIEVKNAVYDSFYASKFRHNLIYLYNDITEEPRRARVRILTRRLWYELCAYR